jgi:hypothetical protein
MKKLLIVIVFFETLLNLQSQEIFSRQKGKIIYMDEPEYTDSRIIDDMKYPARGNIIGWSPNGLVAYEDLGLHYDFNYGPPRESIEIKLVIFNAVEDKILEKIEVEYNKNNMTEKSNALNRLNVILRRYNINGGMENYLDEKIGGELLQFPIRIGNITYDSWLEATVEALEDDYGWDERVIKWDLIVSNGTGNKRIAAGKNPSIGYGYGTTQIMGYYKSPYENRIIVAIRNFQRGFEGDIGWYIGFYGCHLGFGFD